MNTLNACFLPTIVKKGTISTTQRGVLKSCRFRPPRVSLFVHNDDMRISNIPHIYRNVKRWTEIISVLSKYGLADWLSQTNIEFIKTRLKDRDGEILSNHTREARIRLALTELGPTFIKLGQLFSTRPDLVGKELADELRQLQSEVPADTPEQVRHMLEAELGEKIESLFLEFDLAPIASASIGQVHSARLTSGERVVVKVQHAGIERKVQEDLDVLAGLAMLAEQFPEFANYRPSANVAEMGRMLKRELDFGREERNLNQFASVFRDDPTICIPRPWTDYCTARVLTMDFIDGISIAQPERLIAAGIDTAEVARRGAEIYLNMIFTQGHFHADPHPGNIVVLPGNVIGLLDFGMVGRIEERLREDIEEMLVAMVQHDTILLSMLIQRIGRPPANLDQAGLTNDIADFVGHYSTQSLDKFDLSGALTDIMEIIRRYRIQLPPQVALLIKVLVTLEGSAKLLSPKFSLMELMQPFQKRMFMRRLNPLRHLKKMRRFAIEVEQLAEILPRRAMDILDQVQAGKFDVHLDHRGLGPSVNRLVLGLLTSALFLGSSLLLAYTVPPVLFPTSTYLGMHKISILGLLGCITSLLLGLRLIHAIGKSGHLDQK
jgi:ubiquinone biosynthesis protein